MCATANHVTYTVEGEEDGGQENDTCLIEVLIERIELIVLH